MPCFRPNIESSEKAWRRRFKWAAVSLGFIGSGCCAVAANVDPPSIEHTRRANCFFMQNSEYEAGKQFSQDASLPDRIFAQSERNLGAAYEQRRTNAPNAGRGEATCRAFWGETN